LGKDEDFGEREKNFDEEFLVFFEVNFLRFWL
jgi:hypothetical protein